MFSRNSKMTAITNEDVISYLREHGYEITLATFETEVKSKLLAGKGVQDSVDVATKIIAYNPCENDPYGTTNMPIYQTATFKQPGMRWFSLDSGLLMPES